MMFRHVMVPYDGSDHAKNALNYAKDLVAGDADAKLSVVHAVPSSYMGVDRMGTDGALDGVPYGMLDYEEYQGVVKRVLDEAQKRVAEELYISPSTAHAHIKRIYAKTGLHSRQEILDFMDQYTS